MVEIKKNSTRLIINTVAQYIRTIINLLLSLYSTRLILKALGVEDYGIFTLIAGVVAMLAFITNAMITTTQRFMSYHQAKSDLLTQQKIFSNSLLLHIIFSIIVLTLLELASLFLFDGFLNITPSRLSAARSVYQCTIIMVITSFLTAPYKALIISHENLIYTSIINVLDGVAKVIIALLLVRFQYDKLVVYGYLMVGLYILNLFAYSLYDLRNYKECIMPKIQYLNKDYITSMSSFVGWQLYSTGCIIGRTQGTAIILNKFFSTVVNAAFGIALQINGAISFLSSSIMLAITPQIVKAEGAGQREKMFSLAATASKFSFLLLAMVAIPVIFHINSIIQLWLGEEPAYSSLFCRVIIITALVDQLTIGLGTANTAIGNIRNYSLIINSIKILTLPILIILFLLKVPLDIAIWCYPLIELICSLMRIPYLSITSSLNIKNYLSSVFSKIPIPLIYLILVYTITTLFPFQLWTILLISIIICIVYGVIIYNIGLENNEKYLIKNLVHQIIRKL